VMAVLAGTVVRVLLAATGLQLGPAF